MTRTTLDQVRRALALPRPGRAAQALMTPHPRPGDILPPPPENPSKEAGVLILLFARDQDLYFILTVRTLSVATHKGQVSLPGGAREPGERLDETARREASEELGIPAEPIEFLGPPLTPLYIPVSEFWVTPFVGYWRDEPLFHPAPEEVIRLLETPLSTLLDNATIVEEEWELRGDRVRVPFFNIQGNKVWGATAMMLSEFKALLERDLSGRDDN
jgi:8-oxo-dGTP pyrophosphatase MutT (NUDIX family)